jgi:hypothetical protein
LGKEQARYLVKAIAHITMSRDQQVCAREGMDKKDYLQAQQNLGIKTENLITLTCTNAVSFYINI